MSTIESNIKSEGIWPWLEQIKKKFPVCQALEIDSIEISEPERAEIGASYLRVAHRLDRTIIYLAGSLIHGRKLGDDSFSDFRNWLIWCGLEIVEAAITRTDELYDRLVAKNFNINKPYCENLSELGAWAPPSREVERSLSLEEFLGENYEEPDGPLTAELLEKKLPKLWLEFGKEFGSEQDSGLSGLVGVYIGELGLVRVGDAVFHKNGYGEGEILELLDSEGLVLARFGHEEKTFRLDPEFVDRVKNNGCCGGFRQSMQLRARNSSMKK
ncbi:DUF4240 domain-containing protein [Variovorax sp. ZS18.2.2]|nr:DUF4240 domain-containing protein [Variovorax sp. ZS18.2.2]